MVKSTSLKSAPEKSVLNIWALEKSVSLNEADLKSASWMVLAVKLIWDSSDDDHVENLRLVWVRFTL